MKSIQWIMIVVLWVVTGAMAWSVWTDQQFEHWHSVLTLWFAWYAFQVTLRVPQRIQYTIRLLSTLGLLVGLGWMQWSSQMGLSDPLRMSEEPFNWGLGLGGLSAVLLLWLRYAERGSKEGTVFVRHSIVLSLCSVTVEGLRYKGIDGSQYWTSAVLVWFSLVAVVDCGSVLWNFRDWNQHRQHTSPVLEVVSRRLNPIQSMFDTLEQIFGIDIQGTWIIRFVRQMLEPMAVVLVVFGWLSTSVVQIHPHEQGVRSHFGQSEKVVLQGGLHWKLPYPFGRVDRVVANRIHQMSIGHAEIEEMDTEEEAPESILWANQHGDEEFLLLLGDGHDVMSADGMLEYRIVDVHQYLFGVQNPEEVLESVVYQVLMEQTASRTLEEALSENLIVLAGLVTTEIQERIALYEIGIEPLLFTFTALHPPVSVAKEYQDVVSAQIDQQTSVLRAEQYQLSTVPKTRAKLVSNVEKAKQSSVLNVATATGEAVSFEALRQTVRSQESLYRFRRRQENLQQSIKGRNIVVLDHRLESQGATLWINP